MGECICSSCKNLKGIINDTGDIEQYECEFGFPSATCETCTGDECDITCSNYICDEEDEKETKTLVCKSCGKELKQVCSDADEGEVYCLDCYLRSRDD